MMVGSTLFNVTFALLWILTILNSLVLLAMVRQVGVVLLRVGQIAPARPVGGPVAGDRLTVPGLPQLEAGISTPYRLLLFVSLHCGTCAQMIPAANAVARKYRDFEVVLVGDASPAELSHWARENGAKVRAVAAPNVIRSYGIPGTPFACVLDAQDVVLRVGGVNHLDHIETLITSCLASNVTGSSDVVEGDRLIDLSAQRTRG